MQSLGQGDRHEHLKALCSVLLQREVDPDSAAEILIEAWTQADDELAQRAPREVPNTLRTSAQAIEAGRATGVPSMEKLTPGLFDELKGIFGWKPKVKMSEGKDGKPRREGNQAKRLIAYAMEDTEELFVDQHGSEHALVGGAPVPLDRGSYGWLRRLFWEREGDAASTELLGTVAGQLKAFAEVSGNERTLYLRAAQHEGAVYLYLGPGPSPPPIYGTAHSAS